MDNISRELRSEIMSRVRQKNTRPEMKVRRLVHGMGYRYRLHQRDLPGRPDMVFSSRRKIIFVHGCFWHRHPGCARTRTPKSRVDFWRTKFVGNRQRDLKTLRRLHLSGWSTLVVWECDLEDAAGLEVRLRTFLADN